jgi:hypothetical protein
MDDASESQSLTRYLKRLEERISRIEVHLGIRETAMATSERPLPVEAEPEEEDWLEFRVGQFLVAQAGIVTLVVGISFLLTLPFARLPRSIPLCIGYVLTCTMFALAYYARRSFGYVAHCLVGGGLFLLYFTTLRLHFFVANPIVDHRLLETALLSAAVIAALAIAAYGQSIILVVLGLTLGFATAILSDEAWFLLPAVLSLTLFSAVLRMRYRWSGLLSVTMLLFYVTYALWLFNNPIMSGDIHLVSSPGIHLLFLTTGMTVFAIAGPHQSSHTSETRVENAAEFELLHAFINACAGYGLYLAASSAVFTDHLAIAQLCAAGGFIALASVCWLRYRSRYATFVYAMVGYAALTVAIVVATEPPAVFLWLCWQSMLVLCTSLWFRSKFIIVGNFIIYIGVLLAYVVMAGGEPWPALHFGVVALLSARILNWQKNRLELRTEFMRNCYLAAGFVILPYGLAQLVPGEYLGFCWLGLGVMYYALSLLLSNKKYRWMALLTLLLTVLYVFIVGIVRLDPVYRIISLMVLGIVLLVVSLVYTRYRARPSSRGLET